MKDSSMNPKYILVDFLDLFAIGSSLVESADLFLRSIFVFFSIEKNVIIDLFFSGRVLNLKWNLYFKRTSKRAPNMFNFPLHSNASFGYGSMNSNGNWWVIFLLYIYFILFLCLIKRRLWWRTDICLPSLWKNKIPCIKRIGAKTNLHIKYLQNDFLKFHKTWFKKKKKLPTCLLTNFRF